MRLKQGLRARVKGSALEKARHPEDAGLFLTRRLLKKADENFY